ncbi:MAG: hypothetical protein JWN44_3179 [Myxococcales bacterium]|nr:hypothetical protein [Myxococcales bacterium]
MAGEGTTRRTPRLWIFVVLAVTGYYFAAVQRPSGPRALNVFDADRLADLEAGMWQAYYAKDKTTLFRLLVTMLREQYRYPWSKAVRAAYHLARAAATFGDATGDYDRVLPDLTKAYAIAGDWTHAGFDPAAVARAELSWWVARRDPTSGAGAQKNRVVTERMTELYALLYEVPKPRVAEAARQRVEAADLRDRGGDGTVDWKAVSWLLHESYRSLHLALAD